MRLHNFTYSFMKIQYKYNVCNGQTVQLQCQSVTSFCCPHGLEVGRKENAVQLDAEDPWKICVLKSQVNLASCTTDQLSTGPQPCIQFSLYIYRCSRSLLRPLWLCLLLNNRFNCALSQQCIAWWLQCRQRKHHISHFWGALTRD